MGAVKGRSYSAYESQKAFNTHTFYKITNNCKMRAVIAAGLGIRLP